MDFNKHLDILWDDKKPAKAVAEFIETIPDDTFESLKDKLFTDQRKAVITAVKRKEKNILKAAEEAKRMTMMFAFENDILSKGFQSIAGIDEAGRGPLAGPVVAGVAVIDIHGDWQGIDDSKKLTESQRDYFFDKIKNEAVTYGIGIADHQEIDTLNILEATKVAMKRAIEMAEKKKKLDFLLIDAVSLDDISIRQLNLIKGDARSASIAAASILAKVTRDRIMDDYDELFHGYGFKKHKGYGTAAHYDALNAYGATEIHRESFIKKWRSQNNRWD